MSALGGVAAADMAANVCASGDTACSDAAKAQSRAAKFDQQTSFKAPAPGGLLTGDIFVDASMLGGQHQHSAQLASSTSVPAMTKQHADDTNSQAAVADDAAASTVPVSSSMVSTSCCQSIETKVKALAQSGSNDCQHVQQAAEQQQSQPHSVFSAQNAVDPSATGNELSHEMLHSTVASPIVSKWQPPIAGSHDATAASSSERGLALGTRPKRLLYSETVANGSTKAALAPQAQPVVSL